MGAWDFFHGTSSNAKRKSCPLIFRYIEDKDIWRWTLRRSKEFSAAQELELAPPPPGRIADPKSAFAPWKRLYDGGEKALDAMISRGSTLVDYQNQLVHLQARSARIRTLKEAPEHKAYVVNATVLSSELGNE